MAPEHVDLVRAMYAYSQSGGNLVEAYNDEEFVRVGEVAFVHLAHPDFELVLLRGKMAADEVYPGVEGFWAGMREWLSSWESYAIELEGLVDLDDRVVALTVERGISRVGRVPLVQSGAVVYTFRDDKVLQIETYLERRTAFAALGLTASRVAELVASSSPGAHP